MVFVCNESHSDTFNPIQKSAKGIVQVFTSTKSGKRFQKTETKFNENKTLNGNKWNVKVDRKRKYQKIIGFGGAFTDATVLGIGKLSPKLQKQIISDLFSESGLEYSVARTTISGSDFSARPYSYDDTENDWELKNFSLADEDIKYRVY